LSDEQGSPEVEANSEAVTRGRMTAEEGMDASSIVGIVLGFVGLVSIVGQYSINLQQLFLCLNLLYCATVAW
jgi:hypothetical protein